MMFAFGTVLLLAYLAAVHPTPLERGLSSRLNHLAGGPGSENPQFHFEQYLVRQTRKDTSSASSSGFDPYLMFRTRPPVELTLQKHASYVLECEVSGSPKPTIHWERNGVRIAQGPNVYDESSLYGELSLSMVKSRLFLDCITEEAVYTCVSTSGGNNGMAHAEIKSQTHVKIMKALEAFPSQQEEELFGSAVSNSIGGFASAAKASLAYDMEAALTGCVKKSFGTPARIYFWTQTTLENLGTTAVLHCRASGFPTPSIRWFSENEQPLEATEVFDSPRHQVLATGDLLIRNVSFSDMGKYRCVAANKHGSDMVEKIFFYPTDPNSEQ